MKLRCTVATRQQSHYPALSPVSGSLKEKTIFARDLADVPPGAVLVFSARRPGDQREARALRFRSLAPPARW
jgi:hypothetical protein